jgi:hypothetical protein
MQILNPFTFQVKFVSRSSMVFATFGIHLAHFSTDDVGLFFVLFFGRFLDMKWYRNQSRFGIISEKYVFGTPLGPIWPHGCQRLAPLAFEG